MQQRDIIIFVILITTNLALEPMLILLCARVYNGALMQKQFLMTINIFLARAISEKNKTLINNNSHSYCAS